MLVQTIASLQQRRAVEHAHVARLTAGLKHEWTQHGQHIIADAEAVVAPMRKALRLTLSHQKTEGILGGYEDDLDNFLATASGYGTRLEQRLQSLCAQHAAALRAACPTGGGDAE